MQRSDRDEQHEEPDNQPNPDAGEDKPLDPYELAEPGEPVDDSPASSPPPGVGDDGSPPDFGGGQAGATASFGNTPAPAEPSSDEEAPAEPADAPEETSDGEHELEPLEPAAPPSEDRPATARFPLDDQPATEDLPSDETPVIDEGTKARKREEARRRNAEAFAQMEAARRKRRWIITGVVAFVALVAYVYFAYL